MDLNQTAILAFSRRLAADLLVALRFCTRLPVPALPFETAPYGPLNGSSVRMLPLAGAVIGLCAAAVLAVAAKFGMPPPLPALLALCALIGVTGALHEDGLADCADGFGGGATPEQRLDIMRDSRLGTFGALALILALALRGASLAAIATQSLGLAACVLIATAATSRGLALMPLRLLPPARAEGLGQGSAVASANTLTIAAVSAAILALLPLFAGASLMRIIVALLISIAGAASVTLMARRAIGGQTGDVAGAAQQIAEICSYLVFAAAV